MEGAGCPFEDVLQVGWGPGKLTWWLHVVAEGVDTGGMCVPSASLLAAPALGPFVLFPSWSLYVGALLNPPRVSLFENAMCLLLGQEH